MNFETCKNKGYVGLYGVDAHVCGQATIVSGVGAGQISIKASYTDHEHFKQSETVLYLRRGTIIDPSALAASMGQQTSLTVVQVSAGAYEQLPFRFDAKLLIGKDWLLAKSPINNKRLPSAGSRIVTS
jgi:hypothetical protein